MYPRNMVCFKCIIANPHIKVKIKNVDDDRHDRDHVSQGMDSLRLSLVVPDH